MCWRRGAQSPNAPHLSLLPQLLSLPVNRISTTSNGRSRRDLGGEVSPLILFIVQLR